MRSRCRLGVSETVLGGAAIGGKMGGGTTLSRFHGLRQSVGLLWHCSISQCGTSSGVVVEIFAYEHGSETNVETIEYRHCYCNWARLTNRTHIG